MFRAGVFRNPPNKENYYVSFNNSSIIEHLLASPSLRSILQNKSCSMIYCHNKGGCGWCEEISDNDDKEKGSETNNISVNLSILREYIANDPINRSKTLFYLYQHPELKDQSIGIIFSNTTLRNIAYLQLALYDPDTKDLIVETLNGNQALKNKSLEGLFFDDASRETVIAIVASDRDLQERLFKPPFSLRNSLVVLLWNYWLEILIIWAILEVLSWGRRLSRSMAINDFIDESSEISEKEKKPLAKGLGPQLVAKLNWIYHIYDQIDEHRSLSTVAVTDMPSSAAIKADEVVSILGSGEILDATSKLPLGLMAVPQKMINDLANFLFKHPSITGTLHKQSIEGNDVKFLTARMVSKKRPLSWRVEGKDEWTAPWDPNPGQSKTPEAMIDELAYQIFADLAFPSRMVSWRAVRSFSEGLRMYRRCLRNEMDKDLSLQEAERFFLQATSEDQEFAWAYYNLGVVYTEMDEPQAAYQAFSKAREISPGAWQMHYALALNLFRCNSDCNSDSREVIALCEKALNLHPNLSDRSRILELKGLAYKRLKYCKQSDKESDKESKNSLKSASFFAISALAGAYFHEDDVLNKRILLSKCLQDLAKCHEESDGNGINEDILKNAYSITPEDLNLWYDLAICQKSISKKELSISKKEFEARCKATIDNYWDSTPGDLKRLANYCKESKELKELGYCDSLDKLARYRSQVESRSTEDISIEAKEPCHLDDIQRLNYARWALLLAERATTQDETKRARDKIEFIIDRLEESIQKNTGSNVANYFGESLILCALAQCYHKHNSLNNDSIAEVAKKNYFYKDEYIIRFLSDQDKEVNIGNTKLNVENFRKSKRSFPHAYRHMVKSLSKKLDDTEAHSLYTDDKKRDFMKYFNNKDYQLAKDTMLEALMLDPNDPTIRYSLGIAYVHEALALSNKYARKKNLKVGENYLNQSLKLYRSNYDKSIVNYWLGWLCYESRDLEEAVDSLNICKAMLKESLPLDDSKLWPVYLELGQTYLKLKRYRECEYELKQIKEYHNVGPKEDAFNHMTFEDISIYSKLFLASAYLDQRLNLDKVEPLLIKAEELNDLRYKFSLDEIAGADGFKSFLKQKLNTDWTNDAEIEKLLDENKKFIEVMEDGKQKKCYKYKLDSDERGDLEGYIYALKGWSLLLQAQGVSFDPHNIDIGKGNPVILDKAYIENLDLIIKGDKYLLNKVQIKNAIISIDKGKTINVLKANIHDATMRCETKIRGVVEGSVIESIDCRNYLEYNGRKIRNADLASAVLEEGSIEIILSGPSDKTESPLIIINESISWLEKSFAIVSDPQTCLHLAQALEVKLDLTTDSKSKEAITREIRARCILAKQLDIMEDYKDEIGAISKKYEEKKEKKEEAKEKAKPTSTISLSIEGTAKGEMTAIADSEKKKV